MDLDYEKYIETLPKFAVNWNRDAVAPPKAKPIPVVQNRPRRTKQQRKPATKPTKEKDPLFEDVVFVTPPMTPEVPDNSIIPVTETNKKDDFWDVYDKGLPSI